MRELDFRLVNPANSHQPFVFSSAVTATASGNPAHAPNDVVAAGATQTDALVQDTRREISQIVREVATAARSERSTKEFFSLFIDRTVRAMAAEGAVIWRRDIEQPDASPEPVYRLGRITDRDIPAESSAVHQLMLSEVAKDNQPVVVPASPGATATDVPANPTHVPVAVVPIANDPSAATADYVIEVFLEPEGGIATQRGYLRFVAQMADLAGEYLRAQTIRQFHQSRIIGRRVDNAINRIHQPAGLTNVEAAIVDSAVDVFGFERVGLCRIDSPRTKLAAVSHVDKIDQRSDAARQIRDAATTELDQRLGLIVDEQAESVGLVVSPDSEDESLRLVAFGDVDQAIENSDELKRFAQHAGFALRNANRIESIPGGRLLTRLAPAVHSNHVRWWMRPSISATILTLLIVATLFPLPMYVQSPATIHPTQVQRLTAPRDAIVQTIHVDHGQSVSAGSPLVTLFDPDLEQQMTQLIGRRAVLIEKQTRWNGLLVDTAGYRRDQIQSLQGEQSLVREEILSIDSELEHLRVAKSSLTLRAKHDGTVNAWRLRENLSDRPLTRGDEIAQVIEVDSAWVADVKVPQNRIQHIQRIASSDQLQVQVSMESRPTEKVDATFVSVGPSMPADSLGVATTIVRVRMPNDFRSDSGSLMAGADARHQNSVAPARAVFHCGNRPAGYLLLQDIIRSAQTTFGLYFGKDTPAGTDA